MPIVTKRDIQEFKDTKNVLSVSIFKFMRHWHLRILIQSDNELTLQSYMFKIGSW
jgi:hypothetical protein